MKNTIFGTLRLPRLGKYARGGRGQKSRKCPEKNRTTEKKICSTLYLVLNNREVAPNMYPRRIKKQEMVRTQSGHGGGEWHARILKARIYQNQEENAATELKRGKCCEGV